MEKEELVKKFNESKIFNELKDVYFDGMRDMRSRYRELDVDFYSVYRRIINYRIKKYGSSCFIKPNDEYRPTTELLKKASMSANRKRKRLRGR